MAKNTQPEVVEDITIVIPDNATTSTELDLRSAIPSNAYDCAIWDNLNLPLDVAMSRAYVALKIGGIFIVDKTHPSVEPLLDVLLSLFDLKEKNGDQIIFVKEK